MTVQVDIDGVGTVEIGDEFRNMSPQEQNGVIAHIVEQTKKGVKSGLPSNQEDPGFLADAARSIGRAVPFNDRIVAGLKTLTGTGEGADYATNLENERKANESLIQRHPFLGNMGTAAASMLVPLAPAAAASNATTMLGKVGLGAATGAGIGSVMGASSAPDFTDPAGTAKNIAGGTALGGLLGGAMPLVAKGIGSAYSGVRGLLDGGASGMSRAATGHIAGAIEADTPQVVQSEVSRLGPNAMLADAGPASLGKAQGAALNSDDGRSIVTNALNARKAGANGRIINTVNNELGQAESPQTVTNNLRTFKTAVDNANYTPALTNAPPVNIAPLAVALEQSRAVNDGTSIGRAVERLNNALYETRQVPGYNQPQQVLKTDAENLHRLKMELDNMINYDAPGLGVSAGSGQKDNAILKTIRYHLNDALEQNVPGYAEANAASSALNRRIEAVDKGTKVLGSGPTAQWPEDLARDYAAMEPGERAALFKGTRGEIERNIRTKANDLTALKDVIKGEGDWNRERLSTVVGPGPTNRLINTLESEAKFADTHNKVVENSQTAQRTAAAKNMKPEPASETPFFNPNSTVSGMTVTAAKKGVGLLANQFRADPTRSYGEVADILTRQGQERDKALAAIMDYLNRRQTFARQGGIVGNSLAAPAVGLLGYEARRRLGR